MLTNIACNIPHRPKRPCLTPPAEGPAQPDAKAPVFQPPLGLFNRETIFQYV